MLIFGPTGLTCYCCFWSMLLSYCWHAFGPTTFGSMLLIVQPIGIHMYQARNTQSRKSARSSTLYLILTKSAFARPNCCVQASFQLVSEPAAQLSRLWQLQPLVKPVALLLHLPCESPSKVMCPTQFGVQPEMLLQDL